MLSLWPTLMHAPPPPHTHHPHQDAAYWSSWALTHWVTLATSGLLCAAVGWYPFRHSSLALMAAFYCLFSAALISYSYWLSTWFSSSRVAGTATQFVYALSMLPG
jgi:ATP-binding cassette subfamily A (ABC1) protein 1/ATP-binding cassette subfamily A (ABC1) protein 3